MPLPRFAGILRAPSARYAVGAGCALALTVFASSSLMSCRDPTIGSGYAEPSGNSGSAACPGGAQPGPIADAGYCNNPAGYEQTFNEECMPSDDWIPGPGLPPVPVRMFTPPPHPDSECPFYRGAYQNFMIAMNPLGSGAGAVGQQPSDPLIVNYPTIDDAFQFTHSHLPRNSGTPPTGYSTQEAWHNAVASGPATGRCWLGAVRQAGYRNVLIDQDNHTIYYGLHMNQAFYDFIQQNHLNTVAGVLTVPQNLALPPGLVEFKTAWKDVDPQDFPDANGNYGTPNGVVPPPPEGDFAINGGNKNYMIPTGMGTPGLPTVGRSPTWDANYITTMAWVPYLTQNSSGVIIEDCNHPILRKVALVAIHAVYTLPDHPEFIWGSIQHVDLNAYDPAAIAFAGVNIQGAPDTQPDTTGPGGTPALPSLSDPQNSMVTAPPSMNNYLLYHGGTPENQANQAVPLGMLKFDEATQSFPNQGAKESVYRMFPGSKADRLSPDTAVFSLNSNLNALYGNAIMAKNIDPTIDKRFNYRLVSAVWMDKPYFFGIVYPGTPLAAQVAAGSAAPVGVSLQNDDGTNPLVAGLLQTPPNLYPSVSQGNFCGTPLDNTRTSGDSPNATGANNTVSGCSTRADDLAWGDDPSTLYKSVFSQGFGPSDGPNDAGPAGIPPIFAGGTDYEFSLLAGEDRLSSTAMETFTQNGTFHNCFACHNTQPISTNGVPLGAMGAGGIPLLSRPAMINVSHLFSEFVLRDSTEVCPNPTAADGAPVSIPCPGVMP
jgi:hypothetical protein